MMTRQQAIDFLLASPVRFAHMIGFDKLVDFHNDWIIEMVRGREDKTLQGHRGSYKTTCLSIALALLIIMLPNKRILFMRKTDDDVKEVIKQVKKILEDGHTRYFVQCIYGVDLRFTVTSANEISTNLTTDVRGTSQLFGMGIGSSLTGKHFDRIFTDDIVNLKDRISKAERDHTKSVYQELQNIKNRGGRIYNTGTPWHKDDCFTLMPNPEKWDYKRTGLISAEEIEEIRQRMTASLFAANYDLRHIAAEDVIFLDPTTGGDPAMVEQGTMHVDSAFYGEDYTAWTIMRKQGDKYYVYGKMRRKHVEDCYTEILEDYSRFMCDKIYNENNADKGMVGRDLRKLGAKVVLYAEHQNKYIKIVTYLKAIWKDVIFVNGTDNEYINQICDYSENAEHDDAPDSVASLARLLYKKRDESTYIPIW